MAWLRACVLSACLATSTATVSWTLGTAQASSCKTVCQAHGQTCTGLGFPSSGQALKDVAETLGANNPCNTYHSAPSSSDKKAPYVDTTAKCHFYAGGQNSCSASKTVPTSRLLCPCVGIPSNVGGNLGLGPGGAPQGVESSCPDLQTCLKLGKFNARNSIFNYALGSVALPHFAPTKRLIQGAALVTAAALVLAVAAAWSVRRRRAAWEGDSPTDARVLMDEEQDTE